MVDYPNKYINKYSEYLKTVDKDKNNIDDWNTSSDNNVINPKDSPKEDFNDKLYNMKYYKVAEVGIVHPTKTSSIKIKDNGMIELWVGTNQGIRIDPNTKSITMIANRFDTRVADRREWVDLDSVMNIRRNFELFAGKDIVLNCEGDFTLDIGGSLNINCKDGVKMDSPSLDLEGDVVNIKSKGNINLTAGENLIVDAKKYDHK
jgi:hypothetical protein